VRWCRPTAATGERLELLHLPEGADAKAWQGVDAAGKLVFTHVDPARAFAHAAAAGAAGLVSDFSTAPEAYPDRVHWCNVWTRRGYWGTIAEDPRLLGFSISPRAGEALRTRLGANAGPLQVHARVDARLYAGTGDIVSAAIPGARLPEQEIVFYAHVYEPLFDDNALAAGFYLEAVRLLADLVRQGVLPPPQRTLRFVLGWEWIGSQYYAARCKGERTWLASICHDSIATRQELTKSPLTLYTSPFFSASFADALFLDRWERLFGPRCPAAAWKAAGWCGPGTDVLWVDPTLGNVSNLFPHQRVGPTWHKSGSSRADIDVEVLRNSGLVALVWALEIAYAGASAARSVAALAAARLAEGIRQHAQAVDANRRDGARARAEFACEQACLREKAGKMLSVSVLAPDDAGLAAHVEGLRVNVEEALRAAAEAAEARRAAAAAEVPAWEEQHPGDYRLDREERLAANCIPRRRVQGLLWSLARLSPAEGDVLLAAGKVDPIVLMRMDGKRSLLDLARESATAMGRALDPEKLLRACRLAAQAGYIELAQARVFDQETLAAQLAALGVAPGDVLLVHSSLSSLGPLAHGPETVFAALEQAVGPAGTVAMPSFAYNTVAQCPDAPFDAAATPSRVGALTDLFWIRPGVRRSRHPSHGLAAWGRHAARLVEETLPYSPYDIRGAFGRLDALDAKILMLGCGLAANSTLHALEDWANLPSMKPDRYHYLDERGVRQEIEYAKEPFFGRSFYTTRLCPYERVLRARGLLVEGEVGLARSFLMRSRALMDTGLAELRAGRVDMLLDPASADPHVQEILREIRENWTFPPTLLEDVARLREA